jgi:L-ascorbate metabolism protein UlaG (beta-lactamase superfamily)
MNRRRVVKWLGLGGLAAVAGTGAVVSRAKAANPYYQGPVSDHFDGRIFFNPDGQAPGGLLNLLKWQFAGGRTKWPASVPSPFAQAKPEARVAGGRITVTMVGHASLLVQTAGLNLLTDPVWSERMSPYSFAGPKRVNPPGIAFEDLPPIDLVLVSHNHYDHLDTATLARLHQQHDPLVITPLGNDTIIRAAAPQMRIVAADWGDAVDAPGGARVHVEPAHHWSARWTSDRRMALWGGFVVETAAGKIYFAGDTGFHGGVNYRALGEKHDGFRFAILPIGAYEPRWFMKPQHQNPDEAVQGMLLCKAEYAAGCHWGTIQLTDEPSEEPAQHLLQALDAHRIAHERFRPMRPGEIWEVPQATG